MTACEGVQSAIVGRALADADRAHAETCAECGFFLALSRGLSAAWPVAGESPLGSSLSAALAAACEQGEPLLGRWRLERKLGRGGQAEVYRAIDLDVGEPVAVKLVRSRGDEVTEVALARKVVHPGVCRVFHTERFGELRLIVMELFEGGLAGRTDVPYDRAVAWWIAICDAVAAAHAAGVLHLDLKPDNIMLRGESPVVTDFGLARRASDPQAASGGTLAFMAPEQRSGAPVDARTDVYALGLIGKRLLGKPRWRHARVIRRATAERAADRYANAGELARALAPRRRGRWIALAAASVIALAVAALAVVPPPGGPRALWREDLWGPDLVPREAWNVAHNRDGDGEPRVLAEPVSGCARKASELVDGVAQYGSWEHGVAFPASFDVCISLGSLAPTGLCGERRPDGRLCRHRELAPTEPLPYTIGDLARMSAPEIAALGPLGQIEPAVPCGERTLIVELARQWPVFAVRHWYHGAEQVPEAFRIAVEIDGAWQLVYATKQNVEATKRAVHDTGFEGKSAPVTSQFPTVTTARLRLVIDSCTLRDNGQGWLYELEVFAVPSRWRAWWLRIAG